MRIQIMAVTAVLLVAACGSPVVVSDAPAGSAYDGPLDVEVDHSDGADVMARSGAAGLALECDGEPSNGGGADYDSGLASVQEDAVAALDNWLREDGWFALPRTGFQVERDDGDRVLLSYDVGGATRIAVVADAHVTDFTGDQGWGIASWAQCDPAELPAAVTDDLGLEIWLDDSGRRVASTRVMSYPGPEHCDWQDIDFLRLGPERAGMQYVRDTRGEFSRLRGSFADGVSLPPDAVDTGFSREGRHLWVSADGDVAYLVSTDDPDDVERWPGSRRPIYCM